MVTAQEIQRLRPDFHGKVRGGLWFCLLTYYEASSDRTFWATGHATTKADAHAAAVAHLTEQTFQGLLWTPPLVAMR